MANYIIFFRYTSKGREAIGKSPERIEAARMTARKHGADVKSFYALTGGYDTMFIIDVPGEETASRIALDIASQGNVTTEVVRAYDEDEFRRLVEGL